MHNYDNCNEFIIVIMKVVMAPAAEKKIGVLKKVDFQDCQILLSTVSWGGWGGPPANLGK